MQSLFIFVFPKHLTNEIYQSCSLIGKRGDTIICILLISHPASFILTE